jgi:hypothetical protein
MCSQEVWPLDHRGGPWFYYYTFFIITRTFFSCVCSFTSTVGALTRRMYKRRNHTYHVVFFLISCGGVRLIALGTSATIWPIVPAPYDRLWRIWWNEYWQGKSKHSDKTCPTVTLSIRNPTWLEMGSIPDRCGGKSANNRPSYGTAYQDAYRRAPWTNKYATLREALQHTILNFFF